MGGYRLPAPASLMQKRNKGGQTWMHNIGSWGTSDPRCSDISYRIVIALSARATKKKNERGSGTPARSTGARCVQ